MLKASKTYVTYIEIAISGEMALGIITSTTLRNIINTSI